MDVMKIFTPEDFTKRQEQALQAHTLQEEELLLPKNSDLMKILLEWPGKICIELQLQDYPLLVEVVQKDFISEIKRNWKMNVPAPFKMWSNSSKQILVLTPR